MKQENLLRLLMMIVGFVSPLKKRIVKSCSAVAKKPPKEVLKDTLVHIVVAIVFCFLFLRKWLRKLYEARKPVWCVICTHRNSVTIVYWLLLIRRWLRILYDANKPKVQQVWHTHKHTIEKVVLCSMPIYAFMVLSFSIGCLYMTNQYGKNIDTHKIKQLKAQVITPNETPAPTMATVPAIVKNLPAVTGSDDSSLSPKTVSTEEKYITVKIIRSTAIREQYYNDSEVLGKLKKGINIKISLTKSKYGYLYCSLGYIDFEDTNYLEVMNLTEPDKTLFSLHQYGEIAKNCTLFSKATRNSKKVASLKKDLKVKILGHASYGFGFDGYDIIEVIETGKIGYVPEDSLNFYAIRVLYNPQKEDNSSKKTKTSVESDDSKDLPDESTTNKDVVPKDNSSKKAKTSVESNDSKNTSDESSTNKKVVQNDNSSKKTKTSVESNDSKNAPDKSTTNKKVVQNDNSSKKTKTSVESNDSKNAPDKSSTNKKVVQNDNSKKKISSIDNCCGSGGSAGKKDTSVSTGSSGSTGKNSSKSFNGVKLQFKAKYNITSNPLTKSMGVKVFKGHIETYYTEEVLSGGGLNIPGRHHANDGTVRDKDGYICVATHNSHIKKGSILITSLGPAKVYDCCTCTKYNAKKHIDIYTWGKKWN